MTNSQESPKSVKTANDLFYEKADKAFRGLFEVAKTKNELHFALSLSPEFRGAQDAGWNTAADAHVAFREYLDFVSEDPPTDAFDSDIRNGYAHADYIIWSDGIRLRKRNGGFPRIVTWQEFNALFERGINFFSMLSEIVQEYMDSYNPAKEIRGQLSNEPERTWTIYSDPKDGTFTISGGSFVIKPDKNHE